MEEGISGEPDSRWRLLGDGMPPHNGPVDIAQFVQEVEKFNRMTEPFAFLLYVWDDLRRYDIYILAPTWPQIRMSNYMYDNEGIILHAPYVFDAC